jgi:O-antigen ligase
MRRRLSLLAAIALLALPTIVAFARGGYFDAARLRAGIAACLLAALAVAVSERPLPTSVAGRVALGGLAALLGWSALSLTWAPLAGPAVDDVERLTLYLAAFVAAAALLTGRAGRWTEPALLAGIALTAAYGLSERLLPGVFSLEHSVAAGDRLSQPLTYWNGQGALAALGLALVAGIVAGRPGRLAAAAAFVAPLLGLDLYLTLSRGALGATAVGLLVLLALTGTRAALAATVLVAAGAALPAIFAELVFSDVMRADSSSGAGAAMLAVLVLAGAACAFAATRLPRGASLPLLRPLAVAALVATLVVTVAAVTTARSSTPTTGSARLVSVESNRYDYWRVAVGSFADHPLRGIGTGGFRVEWLRHRDHAESVRDAHSLYLETPAELGLVGLAALLALLGGVAAAARRARAPAATAALAAWAVHAGVDWDWELPALTLVAVLLAGRVIAAAEREPERPPERAATAASPLAAAAAPASTSSPPPALS